MNASRILGSLAVLVLALAAVGAQAQERPTSDLSKTEVGRAGTNYLTVPRKVADKKFWAATVATFASAIADEEVTQYKVRVNPDLHETNPLFGTTRKTAYPVILGLGTYSAISSYELKKHGDKLWYLPETVTVGLHTFAVGWNLHL